MATRDKNYKFQKYIARVEIDCFLKNYDLKTVSYETLVKFIAFSDTKSCILANYRTLEIPLHHYGKEHVYIHGIRGLLSNFLKKCFDKNGNYVLSDDKTSFTHKLKSFLEENPVELWPESVSEREFTNLMDLTNVHNAKIFTSTKQINGACFSACPLTKAVESDDLNMSCYLLQNLNADPNGCNLCLSTPLYFAIRNKSVDAMKLLISHGADLDRYVSIYMSQKLLTPLQICIFQLFRFGWFMSPAEFIQRNIIDRLYLLMIKILLVNGVDILKSMKYAALKQRQNWKIFMKPRNFTPKYHELACYVMNELFALFHQFIANVETLRELYKMNVQIFEYFLFNKLVMYHDESDSEDSFFSDDTQIDDEDMHDFSFENWSANESLDYSGENSFDFDKLDTLPKNTDDFLNEVHSLKSLARIRIRQLLTRKRFDRIDELPLPNVMKSYLKYTEIFD